MVRPSRPHSHMLAYKDLTRRRNTETRLCLLCGVPSDRKRRSGTKKMPRLGRGCRGHCGVGC